MIAATFMLAMIAPAMGESAPVPDGQDANEIVVTAARLQDVRIDYRMDGRHLQYCGPRDRDQDPGDVRIVCGHVATCVSNGQRQRDRLAACVRSRIGRRADTLP